MTQPVAVEGDDAIVVDGARKDYLNAAGGRRVAVADVSLRVSRGAIHGLLGPNGAGKTTTLKMLLGLVKPSGGTFSILGKDAAKPGARASLGFLPEQPYFPANLTSIETLLLHGRLSGMRKDEVLAEVPELLQRVGLGGQEKTLIARFSRGMLQRLGLAQAMLGGPEVLVLDEPASGLDPIGQRDVRNLMLELRAEGTTILLSSHQLSEVETVCDEVSILNQGRVVARGDIHRLLNVEGQISVVARGEGELPSQISALITQTAFSGGSYAFSIKDVHVRRVVDALDDAGWLVQSVNPKRDSLEDYFSKLLSQDEQHDEESDLAVSA